MESDLVAKTTAFRSLFDAYPSPCLIVDPDVRIMDMNAAARPLFGGGTGAVLRRKGGDAMRCVHALETPEGCGHAESCKECVIRNSVCEALTGGKPHRTKTRAEIASGSGVREFHLLVTASPFSTDGGNLVLLILEDVSELIRLRQILPICAWCKKIRNDENYWETVETYFKTRAEVDFSHSICVECLEKNFPGRKAAPAAPTIP